MSLIRYRTPAFSHWSSLDRFSSFRDDVNRLFDLSRPSREPALSSGWSPALDVADDKDNLVVTVELPGLKKEEINIALHDGILTVAGERKQERDTEEGAIFRSERTFGKFERSVTLPAAVDSNKVTAAYKDGILTVELPKAEEAKPRKIAVTVS